MKTLMICLGILLIASGCGGSGGADGNVDTSGEEATDTVSNDPLVGTWEVVEVTRGDDFGNTGTMYAFGADGSMSSSSGALSIEGTYTVAGDTIKIVLGGIDMDILHSFEDGNLIYEIVNGEQIFLMEPR